MSKEDRKAIFGIKARPDGAYSNARVGPALWRRFDMGRNTIRRILRKNHKQREKGYDVLNSGRPVERKSKLNAFKAMIKELLEKYPNINGVRIYEKLSESGYDGGRIIYNLL